MCLRRSPHPGAPPRCVARPTRLEDHQRSQCQGQLHTGTNYVHRFQGGKPRCHWGRLVNHRGCGKLERRGDLDAEQRRLYHWGGAVAGDVSIVRTYSLSSNPAHQLTSLTFSSSCVALLDGVVSDISSVVAGVDGIVNTRASLYPLSMVVRAPCYLSLYPLSMVVRAPSYLFFSICSPGRDQEPPRNFRRDHDPRRRRQRPGFEHSVDR